MRQCLRLFCVLLAMCSLIASAAGQSKPNAAKKPAKKSASTAVKKKPIAASGEQAETAAPVPVDPSTEKERLEAALAAQAPNEKADLLVKFIADFPTSKNLVRAKESLSGARAAMADQKLSIGDAAGAFEMFQLAVSEAPKPFSARLFAEVISTIPANLFFRGHRPQALEIARMIEEQAAANVDQLLILSTFYLSTEQGLEARRIAEAAITLDEKNAAAHQALAAAHRLNFDLDSAALALTRSLELDPEAVAAKRSLADIKRATGKADEAEAIYRTLLAANAKDTHAHTGLVMAMFDQGKTAEAEAEMARALEESQANVVLLGSAAYWYATKGNGERAVELARRAIEKEPRFIWSHIALGRGLMLLQKPVDAERALLMARKYGNFPTLQYEIASARLAAGFFQEAAEELRRSFRIEEGAITTSLGGRIEKTGDTFTDVIALERRASILEPTAADTPENARRLKSLLELDAALSREEVDGVAVAAIADRFAAGSDNMAAHRKLFAARRLLQKNVAIDSAAELARSTTGEADRALDVADAGAAVMASELYEARNISFQRDDFLLIPEIPKQTLSALLRGRIEDTIGLSLLKQNKADEAEVRFRRALSVFPKDSAWWRSATWNLGMALQAGGKDAEALDTFIATYKIDKPDAARYLMIEALYRKVNGGLDGFEEKLGPSPLPTFTSAAAKVEPPASVDAASETPAVVESKPDDVKSDVPADRTEAKPESEPVEKKAEAPTAEESKAEAKVEGERAKPSEEKPNETEPLKTDSPAAEVKTETPAEKPLDAPKSETAADGADTKPKNLFDPIVITVPSRSVESAAAKKTDAVAEGEIVDGAAAADARPRVILGKPVTGDIGPGCSMAASQENVSIAHSGGSIGLLISLDGLDADAELAATVSSPADIEVTADTGLPSIPTRKAFVIRSLTDKTGMYQATFRSACGAKTVFVQVR